MSTITKEINADRKAWLERRRQYPDYHKRGRCEVCGRETARTRNKLCKVCGNGTVKHGMYKSAEYRSWQHMNARCSNPRSEYFHRYGGRGITVCDRWRSSFESFLADMGKKPFPGATVERVDRDGNYSPENCRWATRAEQARNTSRNRKVTFGGRTMTLAEWSRETGIPDSTLSQRLKAGWSSERIFSRCYGGKLG